MAEMNLEKTARNVAKKVIQDLIDNGEPSNCKWIPMSEQYKNKQSNYNKMPLPEPYKEVEE